MLVTPETWRIIRNTLRAEGIDRVEDSSDGKVRTIITKSGERFEFSEETLELLGATALQLRRGLGSELQTSGASEPRPARPPRTPPRTSS